MAYYWFAGVAAILLTALLIAEKKNNFAGRLVAKTSASLLFIAAAVAQPHPSPDYSRFIMMGLVFSLFGDVFLALQQKRMFLIGLVSFLFGHLAYILGFATVTHPGHWLHLADVAIVAAFVFVWRWLSPKLGEMKIPATVYMVVISVMLSGAWAVFSDQQVSEVGKKAAFFGAFLFFISDIFVARNQFVKDDFVNPLIGLPLYYAGQFILAFSVGFIGESAL